MFKKWRNSNGLSGEQSWLQVRQLETKAPLFTVLNRHYGHATPGKLLVEGVQPSHLAIWLKKWRDCKQQQPPPPPAAATRSKAAAPPPPPAAAHLDAVVQDSWLHPTDEETIAYTAAAKGHGVHYHLVAGAAISYSQSYVACHFSCGAFSCEECMQSHTPVYFIHFCKMGKRFHVRVRIAILESCCP